MVSGWFPAKEIPIPGTPSVTASMAAATVPEYRTSSPMLGPWFTPENTKSGRSGISACMASMTQSVGVPSICQPPSGRRVGRSGRCRVREWEVPLCSRSGATTVTVPTSRHTSASSASPGARMPSSLVTRIFMAAEEKGEGETGKGDGASPSPFTFPLGPYGCLGRRHGGHGHRRRPAIQDSDRLFQRGARLGGKLGFERAARAGTQISGTAVLVDALAGTVDGELLGIQQLLHQH